MCGRVCVCCVAAAQALVLVPTRELALQTSQVCKELGKHLNIQVKSPAPPSPLPPLFPRPQDGSPVDSLSIH